jgi:hypothetical protein
VKQVTMMYIHFKKTEFYNINSIEFFLWNRWSLSHKDIPYLSQNTGLLPNSQEPSTFCLEPNQSSPHSGTLFFKTHFHVILSCMCLSTQEVSTVYVYWTKVYISHWRI